MSSAPSGAEGNDTKLVARILTPFRLFMAAKASGGILLLIATIAALIWANSPWSEYYHALWETEVSVGFGPYILAKPLILWINDGLMAMFFFVVGLEIKREILVGELSSWRLAALPMAGAIGGMVVPALIYTAFNFGSETARGWGIPMATDIAFALGVLVLLGNRVPAGLRIFLAALAIVDDLGAVLVIAFFYTSTISWDNLALGALFLAMLIGMNKAGVRGSIPYAIVGIGGLWLAFLLSGVHPTIAGVLAALCIPAQTKTNTAQFIEEGRSALSYFENAGEIGEGVLTNRERLSAILKLELLCLEGGTPLQRLEHLLHSWVTFLVMPLFAFANAGVTIEADIATLFSSPAVQGIFFGLIVGKQIGIFGGAWLAVKLGLASLPQNVTWRGVYGVAVIAGIGFTMSIFIAGLAFSGQVLAEAKLAVLISSTFAGVLGYLILRRPAAERVIAAREYHSK